MFIERGDKMAESNNTHDRMTGFGIMKKLMGKSDNFLRGASFSGSGANVFFAVTLIGIPVGAFAAIVGAKNLLQDAYGLITNSKNKVDLNDTNTQDKQSPDISEQENEMIRARQEQQEEKVMQARETLAELEKENAEINSAPGVLDAVNEMRNNEQLKNNKSIISPTT